MAAQRMQWAVWSVVLVAHGVPTANSMNVQTTTSGRALLSGRRVPGMDDPPDNFNTTNTTKQERVSCGSGWWDSCGGNSYYWACGSGCARGKYYTNIWCGCCCRQNVPATPNPTPYPTPYPTFPDALPNGLPDAVPDAQPDPQPDVSSGLADATSDVSSWSSHGGWSRRGRGCHWRPPPSERSWPAVRLDEARKACSD
ncbi:unnamed protein product [Prorocentrum cordatum]|uniref:Cellulase n=1 Tax=Prorocentrum cordatum TaxID=2364126 RepID=A0ABN9VQ72_9DINO|nr:unnamed protein product [Polarella glacialis]